MPRNRENALATAHDDMLALPDNAKSSFLQCAYRCTMRHTR
jgi:hypothetical protein